MKNLSKILRWIAIVVLLSPLVIAWLPFSAQSPDPSLAGPYWTHLVTSFQQLTITLLTTLAVSMALTLLLSYLSVLFPGVGKGTVAVLDGIESIPAILIVLFCYAPVAAMMARNPSSQAQVISLLVFIFSATATILPEAVRGVTLPLWGLYHRKYSVSFRAYGFTKSRILLILLNSRAMHQVIRRTSASVLLKTMVLDCSFGFILQIGMGAYGTPQHTSPGALIATFREAIFSSMSQNPAAKFWLPALLLISISLAFLFLLGSEKERRS